MTLDRCRGRHRHRGDPGRSRKRSVPAGRRFRCARRCPLRGGMRNNLRDRSGGIPKDRPRGIGPFAGCRFRSRCKGCHRRTERACPRCIPVSRGGKFQVRCTDYRRHNRRFRDRKNRRALRRYRCPHRHLRRVRRRLARWFLDPGRFRRRHRHPGFAVCPRLETVSWAGRHRRPRSVAEEVLGLHWDGAGPAGILGPHNKGRLRSRCSRGKAPDIFRVDLRRAHRFLHRGSRREKRHRVSVQKNKAEAEKSSYRVQNRGRHGPLKFSGFSGGMRKRFMNLSQNWQAAFRYNFRGVLPGGSPGGLLGANGLRSGFPHAQNFSIQQVRRPHVFQRVPHHRFDVWV